MLYADNGMSLRKNIQYSTYFVKIFEAYFSHKRKYDIILLCTENWKHRNCFVLAEGKKNILSLSNTNHIFNRFNPGKRENAALWMAGQR